MKNTKEKNKILKSRVAPGRKIGWRIYKDAVLILLMPFPPRPKTKIYELRGLGKDIWRVIKNRRTMEEIVNRIAKKKEVKPEAVEEDIIAFVKKMKAKQLVDISCEK